MKAERIQNFNSSGLLVIYMLFLKIHFGQISKYFHALCYGGPPAWGLIEGQTTPHGKKKNVQKPFTKPRNWADFFIRPRQTNKDMRFGTWNVLNFL